MFNRTAYIATITNNIHSVIEYASGYDYSRNGDNLDMGVCKMLMKALNAALQELISQNGLLFDGVESRYPTIRAAEMLEIISYQVIARYNCGENVSSTLKNEAQDAYDWAEFVLETLYA